MTQTTTSIVVSEAVFRVLKTQEAEALHQKVQLIKNWNTMSQFEKDVAQINFEGC